MIRNADIGKAMCDFGASINLMPLFVTKILSLGELTPTAMTLQMANRTLAHPEGILEDVLIKVGKICLSSGLRSHKYRGRQTNSTAVRKTLLSNRSSID